MTKEREALEKMYNLLLTEPHAPTVCEKLEAIAKESLAQPEQPEQEPHSDDEAVNRFTAAIRERS